jgi:hypothetical protein
LASWRISKRNYLAFQYFGFSRSGSKTLADTIFWGDNVYPAGATTDAHNTVTYYGISYRYYIWRERNWEFGPGLGIDALHLTSELGLRVAASGGGGAVMDSAQKTGGFTAPVPLIGIYGDWEFVPRLLFKGVFQYVYVNDIAGVGGHVSDDALGVEWYPLRNFGVGGVYHFVGADITNASGKNGNKVNFNYVIQGPSFYIIATF